MKVFFDDKTLSDKQKAWGSVLCRTTMRGMILSAAKCVDIIYIAQNGNVQIIENLKKIVQVQLHRIRSSKKEQDEEEEDVDMKLATECELRNIGDFDCLTFKVNQSVEEYSKFAEDHGVNISRSKLHEKKKCSVIKGKCSKHTEWTSDESLKQKLMQYVSSKNGKTGIWDDDKNELLDQWGDIKEKCGLLTSAHPAMRGEYFQSITYCRARLRRILAGTLQYPGGLRCDYECGYECFRCKKQWSIYSAGSRSMHQHRCKKNKKNE